MTARIADIFRYPVKGLSPERLSAVSLLPGETIPGDRAYAIENGSSGFDPAAPRHLPKIHFLMLMRNERLAELQTRYEDETSTLTIIRNGETVAEGRLSEESGRAAIESFFASFSAEDLRGPARILSAPGFSFSDTSRKVLSLINLESVRALEKETGAEIDPLRFRGNLHVEGLPAWDEFGLVGQRITVGGVTFEGVKRIVRCAATNVNPQTAERDMNIPRALMQAYGHADCGVYLQVVTAGTIKAGDSLSPA